jgi:glucokinase
VVDPQGPPCACGGVGCLEAVARGPAVAAWARANGWRDGAPGSARDVADDAARGHPVAVAALQRAGKALGVAIASATHLLDLDIVAIGGGLAQAGRLVFDPLELSLRHHLKMPWAREVKVVAAANGQDAGLVGAAALVLAGDRYWNG